MTNNDILRRIRYIFDLSDDKMIKLFALADMEVSRAEVSDWLKRDDDPESEIILDHELATFLNGFISDRRGKREGPQPPAERRLNNNLILRKLKIALNLKNEDMLAIFALAGRELSPHELSAFFRKYNHPKYRPCKDQYLRNFLIGMQERYRPNV
ncbi:MAG: DUF1456 family protein [Bacteroidota bacterium]